MTSLAKTKAEIDGFGQVFAEHAAAQRGQRKKAVANISVTRYWRLSKVLPKAFFILFFV